jgi:membrane protease YdiL (CAAX protease family)
MAEQGKARGEMSLAEENPFEPRDPAPGAERPASEPMDAGAPGHDGTDAGTVEVPGAQATPIVPVKVYPEDLQISWSWAHFIVFGIFGFLSLVVIQGVLLVVYAPHQKMTQKQLEEYMIGKPQFAIGSLLIWYATIFFFLYVTLSLLRGHPFWQTLGWRKLHPLHAEMPKNPLVYLLAGCGLSLFVALLTTNMKAPEHTPIEELFKYRQTALLFVAMAVLVAPLVEETLFRGYLYPMFARSFGVLPSILLTGVLFGFMHGAQLGWTWSLVALLTLVGIIFTLVRARTGTVFASFLMHLGYNGLISVAALVSTHGFTKMPVAK